MLKFKTDLQCGGCVKKVQPHLEDIDNIQLWEVKLNHANKIMKVTTDRQHADDVARQVHQALQKEGYSARKL